VGLPTETVYGLAADARNPAAVRRIFAAKGRPSDHPLIVHLPSAEHLPQWARDIPEEAWTLAHRFWPGPLTLVLRRSDGVPLEVTGGQETVALRVPAAGKSTAGAAMVTAVSAGNRRCTGQRRLPPHQGQRHVQRLWPV